MDLMTQSGPCEPVATAATPCERGRVVWRPGMLATVGEVRLPGVVTRKSFPGFRPPCRLGSRAFISQQAELSGVDARPVADRSCWVAGGAPGTEHPQADRGPVVIHKFVLTERNPETRGTLVAPRSHGGVGERIGRLWCEAGQLAW